MSVSAFAKLGSDNRLQCQSHVNPKCPHARVFAPAWRTYGARWQGRTHVWRAPAAVKKSSSTSQQSMAQYTQVLDGCKVYGEKQRADGGKKLKLGPSQQNPQQTPSWAILDWSQYNRPWEVKWGLVRLAQGMFGWAFSFIVVGLIFVPVLIYLRDNKDLGTLLKLNQSVLVLISQGLETVIGIGLINYLVDRSGERSADILKLDFSDPLKPPSGWLFWAGLGTVTAPAVVGATAAVFEAISPEGLGGRGTADDVARILSLDIPSYASLLTVTAVLAPLLEETVFRGFLLPSLTKFMPTYTAVIVSSLAFAGCHLSPRDFPQLTALGMLLGFSYVRSRNLLTPMIIHGAWNGTVLTFLFALLSAGFDVQQVLNGK